MKTLYKKDSKGKIRVWEISTNGAVLVQKSGLVGGKMVVNTKVCTPKNVGKSNATTPEEQAILELESEWNQKQDEGYFPTLLEANTVEVVSPMLAKSYNDEKHKIDWSSGQVYIQPKLDGMRCLANIFHGDVTLISRDGKIIDGLEHIKDQLRTIDDDVTLDGELYAHGLGFQENMRLIKKYRPGETEQIKYHVYDRVIDLPFHKRVVRHLISGLSSCVEVSTYQITDETNIAKFHSEFLKDGYEGSIIRHSDDPYKCGRSSNLLKYKDFQDIALKIADIIPAEQRPSWGQFVFYWKGAKGHAYGDDHIGCGMKFSHEEREEFLKNKKKYIGKTAEIRFFEYSEDGVPRFPVCVGIRLDK